MPKSVSSNKEVKNVVRLAIKAGWRIEKTNGGHVLLYPPNKDDGFITMPTSPSSYRNFKNILMMLRAKGLDV